MIRASREARVAMIAAVIAMLALAAPVSARTLSADAATKALNAASFGKTMFPGTRMITSTDSTVRVTKLKNGAKRMTYEVGPFTVIPGQNELGYAPITEKPQVDGWITRIRPDLVYMNGKVPRVDVIHLHHGVWLNFSRPDATAPLPERFFAAGEEKTIMSFPKGYGYRYEASDRWLLNHMIHNLTPVASKVKLGYTIDFIPDGSKAAKGMTPVRPIWMDVENGSLYPGVQRPQGLGQAKPVHLSLRRPEGLHGRGAAEEHLDGRPGRRARGHRRPPASRRHSDGHVAEPPGREGARGEVRQEGRRQVHA